MTSLKISVISALGALISLPAVAQDQPDARALFDAMALPEMIEIMHEEGIEYGAQIGEDLFPGRGNSEWNALVQQIYDTDRMESEILDGLTAELEGEDVAAMLDFFSSELGTEIIGLEVSARRALLDETIEEASQEVAALAIADETPRYLLIREFVETNDLVETNVVGAMNSNYAFYTGLQDGGAFPAELTQEQILADVWSQEPEIRSNTTEWVYTFLMLAYQPLEDEDLRAYIAFSGTDAGQALNTAMFQAFDGMFENISRGLGLGSTRFMQGEEL